MSAGTLLVALGADAPGKQEVDAGLLAGARVVVDDLEQCRSHGELQHVEAGATRGAVIGSLRDVIAGAAVPRESDTDIVVVDSTGTAAQDVAAAVIAATRSRASGRGVDIDLAG